MFYLWGHSYEFDIHNNWHVIEEFAAFMGNRDDIWYATNIEIYDYMQAQRTLVLSADHTMVYNPSAMEVWFSCDGEICSVKPGELWKK